MSYRLETAALTKACASPDGAVSGQGHDAHFVCLEPDALPVIIDVEASGFGYGSYPIEIAFVLADGRVEERLIKPMEHWNHWDAEAQRLHGISRDTLINEGAPASEVAHWLNERLALLEVVYSDSWGFDSSWIGRLFNDTHIIQRFRLESLRKLLRESQLAKWEQTRREIEQSLKLTRHRAGNDVRVLQATYSHSL